MGTSKDDNAASDKIRTISRHSLAYMLCAASEMFRHYDFDHIDFERTVIHYARLACASELTRRVAGNDVTIHA